MPLNNSKTSTKVKVAQWFLQILLSSLLLLLVYKYLSAWLDESPAAKAWIFPLVTLAIVAGTVLGDITLYKGAKLIRQAVFAAFFLALTGIVIGFFLEPLRSSVPWFLDEAVAFGPMVILPVIGYNGVTSVNRRAMHKKHRH